MEIFAPLSDGALRAIRIGVGSLVREVVAESRAGGPPGKSPICVASAALDAQALSAA